MKNKITREDVNKILPQILERISSAFQWSLQSLDDEEKTILSMIASDSSLKDVRGEHIQNLENQQ